MAYINYSPWADAANVGQGLGASLTNLLIALPRLKQEQLLGQAHQAYYGAEAERALAQKKLYEAEVPYQTARAATEAQQAKYYGALTDYNKARTGEISGTEQAKKLLGDALSQIPAAAAVGADITPHITVAVDNLAKLPHADRASLAETLSQMLEMSNPRFRQQLALGQHGIIPVASQGSLYNAVTGQQEFAMPQKLGYGQNLVPAEGGEPIAQGRDRPLADALHSGVFNAAARTFFDRDATDADRQAVMQSIPEFLQALPGRGMPTNAPPIVPGRGKAGPVGKARKNPKTGEWEFVP